MLRKNEFRYRRTPCTPSSSRTSPASTSPTCTPPPTDGAGSTRVEAAPPPVAAHPPRVAARAVGPAAGADATRRGRPSLARPRWGHDRRRRPRTSSGDTPAAPAHRCQGDAGAGPPDPRRAARAAHARRPDDGHRGRRGARRVARQHVVPPPHAGQVRLRRGGAGRHRSPAAVAAGRPGQQLRSRQRRPDHDRGGHAASPTTSPSGRTSDAASGNLTRAFVPQGVAGGRVRLRHR